MKLLPAHPASADLPWRVKVEAFLHLTPNISYPLMIVVSALMLPVMIVRFYMGVWQMVFLDLPLIVASFWSISAFYVIAQRELYPKNWKRSILLLPMLMAVGVALTIINTRAVLEALFGVRDGFCAHAEVRHRRPADEAGSEEVPAPQRLAAVRWRSRSARTSWAWSCSRFRPTTSSRFRSWCCSWAVTTGRASARSTRSIRAACAG